MQKDLKVGMLLDVYSKLLTQKQDTLLNMYYNLDYSLGEIAEIEDISRQAVFDTIKRGSAQLNVLEEKLRVYERYVATMGIAKELEAAGQTQAAQALRDVWEDD